MNNAKQANDVEHNYPLISLRCTVFLFEIHPFSVYARVQYNKSEN